MRFALLLVLAGCTGSTEEPPPESTPLPDTVDTQRACGDQDRCGSVCTDLSSDPLNCGQCGRTCVIDQGAASCEMGLCTLATCDAGFKDCDGDLANGCEAELVCDEGTPCLTECGSPSLQSCGTTGCEPSCPLPAESCNAADDNCDGTCDEGLTGCRLGIHRGYGPRGHMFEPDETTITEVDGARIETLDYFTLYAQPTAELVPFHQCNKPNGSVYMTTSADCDGTGPPARTLGWLATDSVCGATALHRLLGPSGFHFYTVNAPERDNAIANLGYTGEGIAGYVWRDL